MSTEKAKYSMKVTPGTRSPLNMQEDISTVKGTKSPIVLDLPYQYTEDARTSTTPSTKNPNFKSSDVLPKVNVIARGDINDTSKITSKPFTIHERLYK